MKLRYYYCLHTLLYYYLTINIIIIIIIIIITGFIPHKFDESLKERSCKGKKMKVCPTADS